MSQALYRKWRPHLWEQVVGQEHIIRTLQNAIRGERVGHAYLFAGPRGTGKTTTARLLAKAVNCLAEDPGQRPCDQCDYCRAVNDSRFMDLIEIDAASNTSVDDVRDLRDKINFAPTQGRFKVYIIDEVHMLSTAAFNALLKTLEEPPAHAIFILATTEVHKIPATVLSRCQRHEFRRIPVQAIADYLKKMAAEEGLAIEDDALVLIARQATGALRDGISLLDQLASSGEKITLKMAQQVLGTATSQVVVDLTTAILEKNTASGLDYIHGTLDSGTDPRQFARQVVDYLRSLMLIRMGSADQVDATTELRAQMARHAQAFEMPRLMETLRLFNQAANEVRSGWQPGLQLELALAEAVEEKVPAAPATEPMVQTAPAKAAQQSAPPAKTQPASTPPAEQPAANEAPVTAQADNSGKAIDLNMVVKNWDKIRGLLRQEKRHQTEALLNSGKPIAVRDGVLYIGFVTDILKEKMETKENRVMAQKAIARVLGVEVPIACVVVDAKSKNLPADLDVDADGMVGTALNLGAEIVHKE